MSWNSTERFSMRAYHDSSSGSVVARRCLFQVHAWSFRRAALPIVRTYLLGEISCVPYRHSSPTNCCPGSWNESDRNRLWLLGSIRRAADEEARQTGRPGGGHTLAEGRFMPCRSSFSEMPELPGGRKTNMPYHCGVLHGACIHTASFLRLVRGEASTCWVSTWSWWRNPGACDGAGQGAPPYHTPCRG